MLKVKEQINLRVLGRYDRNISAILQTISHVVLYDFDSMSKEWNKRGIEGTLFVYQRNDNTYAFTILNRLSLTNLNVRINPDFQIQQSGEYLMYKTDDTVHGLWIFGDDDRKTLLYQLDDCVLKTEKELRAKVSQDQLQGQIQIQIQDSSTTTTTVSLDEIWTALETMAPHASHHLSENEFLARFRILVQSPFFVRALYLGYLEAKAKA